MNPYRASFALVAALLAATAGAQHAHPPVAPERTPPAPARESAVPAPLPPAREAAPAAVVPPRPPAHGLYRSPFEGFLAFGADTPAVDWRAANEEVRKAGGHAGLMKHPAAPQGGAGAKP